MPDSRINDANLYNRFYKNKSIQRTDKFLITFEPSILFSNTLSESKTRLWAIMNARSGTMPQIDSHHVINVTFPNYEFIKQNSGWTSFPEFQFQGFEFSILFEEDKYATIQKFITWCQRRTIDDAGFQFPTEFSKIGSIKIQVLTENDVVQKMYDYRDVYFLRSTPIGYDYTSTTAQKISITFLASHLEVFQNDSIDGDTDANIARRVD